MGMASKHSSACTKHMNPEQPLPLFVRHGVQQERQLERILDAEETASLPHPDQTALTGLNYLHSSQGRPPTPTKTAALVSWPILCSAHHIPLLGDPFLCLAARSSRQPADRAPPPLLAHICIPRASSRPPYSVATDPPIA